MFYEDSTVVYIVLKNKILILKMQIISILLKRRHKNIRNADTAIGEIYVSHRDLNCCYKYKLMSIILFYIFKFIKQYINN